MQMWVEAGGSPLSVSFYTRGVDVLSQILKFTYKGAYVMRDAEVNDAGQISF